MATQVTLNGITYSLTGSNNIIAVGPGIYRSGISIGNLNSVDDDSFRNAASSPNVEAPAKETLLQFSQADLKIVKDALSPPVAPPPPPPPPPEPTTATATNQQNKEFVSKGGGDDDSGKTSASNTNDGTPSAASATIGTEGDEALAATQRAMDAESAYSEMFGQQPATAGTTVAGKSDTPTAKKTKGPGKRLKNPLADFSSYNYQISLYMITPDAYNAFVTSGRTNINAIANLANTDLAAQTYSESSSGVYLVAQSGGINNKVSNRAPGFNNDFYIDNLEIHCAIANGKSTSSEGGINSKDIKFQIIEPYGFSFITKLKNANNALQKYVSSLPNVKDHVFADRSHYVIGIRFLGYDSQGNVISNLSTLDNTRVTQSGGTGSFEKFFDIKITEISFKIDGRATVYNVKAAPLNEQEGYGIKNGRLLTDTTIVGGTVGEMVNSLVDRLNKNWTDLLSNNGCEIANKYNVKFLGPDADTIRLSSVANNIADSDKTKFPSFITALNSNPTPPTPTAPRTTGDFARQERGQTSTTTNQINERTAITSRVDNNQRQLNFKGTGATSIVQALRTIVLQSDYIQRAIKNLYTNEPEPDRDTDDYETADENSNKTLKWINVSVEVLNLGYDRRRNDWAYEFTYIITSYETPFVDVKVAPNVTPYYGPVKRYDYWLTGKNSEVINFELTYNQLYTTIALGNLDEQRDAKYPVPVMVGHRVAAPNQGRLGPALQSQNTYINNLSDPGAYATAKMTIMGDPDWILQTQASTTAEINSIYDKRYGTDGYTVNCNNGQVYVEVDIKEAIDYDNNQGLLDINENFLFFDYPKIYKEGKNKIRGISFQVTDVWSFFKSGKFTQQLTLIAGIWADANANSPSTSAAQREQPTTGSFARLDRSSAASQGGTNNTTTPAGTKTTGFSEDPPAPGMKRNEYGDWYTPLPDSPQLTGQQTSPTGSSTSKPVADDDSASTGNFARQDRGQIPSQGVATSTAGEGREINGLI